MGAYWGSVYFAITPSNLNYACVKMVDKAPAPTGNGVYVPMSDIEKKYRYFNSEKEARLAVRQFILNQTEGKILRLSHQLLKYKLTKQNALLIKDINLISTCSRLTQKMCKVEQEIRHLKKIRRSKINTIYSNLDTKFI